jgi:hypothetical protein
VGNKEESLFCVCYEAEVCREPRSEIPLSNSKAPIGLQFSDKYELSMGKTVT